MRNTATATETQMKKLDKALAVSTTLQAIILEYEGDIKDPVPARRECAARMRPEMPTACKQGRSALDWCQRVAVLKRRMTSATMVTSSPHLRIALPMNTPSPPDAFTTATSSVV